MGRNGQLIRQWKILRNLLVRRYGATFVELANEFGVSTRTIRRDLECLESAGFPFEDPALNGGRWRFPRDIVSRFLVHLRKNEE